MSRKTGSIHAANPDKSKRLIRVLGVLSSGKEVSTRDIIQRAKVCAVSAIASELRAAGHNIQCKRKASVWYYRMVRGGRA